MKTSDYLEAIQTAAKAENKRWMEAYMRDQFSFLGVKTPERRAVFKPFLAELKKETKTDGLAYDFVNFCWNQEPREHLYDALDYLAAVKKYIEPDDIAWLRSLAEHKSWWDSIDRLDRIIGDVVLRNPELKGLMLEWSEDENFWIRRIAIDHQIGRKEKTDPELLAQILQNNFGSSEFFINKAIGWSLREYSKANPAWVSAFVETHREQMAPLSVREALKRM